MMIACKNRLDLDSNVVQLLLSAHAEVDVNSDIDGMCIRMFSMLSKSRYLGHKTHIFENELGKV